METGGGGGQGYCPFNSRPYVTQLRETRQKEQSEGYSAVHRVERAMLRLPTKKTQNPKQIPEPELAFPPGTAEGKRLGPEPGLSGPWTADPMG